MGWDRTGAVAVIRRRPWLGVFASASVLSAVLTGLFPLHELDGSHAWSIPGLLTLGLVAFAIRRRRIGFQGSGPVEICRALSAK